MNIRLMGAASALALGMAVCSTAAAQTATNSGTDSGQLATAISVPGFNGNNLDSQNDNSNQGNDQSQVNGNSLLSGNALTDNSNNSNQGNDQSQVNGNSLLSGNALTDNSDNSNQGNVYTATRTSTNTTTNTDSNNTTDSGNSLLSGNTTTLTDNSNNSNQGNDNSTGQDNSVDLALRVNLTTQDLGSNVSGVSINAADGATTDNRSIATGALSYSGAAFQNYAGVQTASTNTGIASNNLAATAISANANVTFGGGAD